MAGRGLAGLAGRVRGTSLWPAWRGTGSYGAGLRSITIEINDEYIPRTVGDKVIDTARLSRTLWPMVKARGSAHATMPGCSLTIKQSSQLAPAPFANSCLACGDTFGPVHTVTPLACEAPFAPLAGFGLVGGVVVVQVQ